MEKGYACNIVERKISFIAFIDWVVYRANKSKKQFIVPYLVMIKVTVINGEESSMLIYQAKSSQRRTQINKAT